MLPVLRCIFILFPWMNSLQISKPKIFKNCLINTYLSNSSFKWFTWTTNRNCNWGRILALLKSSMIFLWFGRGSSSISWSCWISSLTSGNNLFNFSEKSYFFFIFLALPLQHLFDLVVVVMVEVGKEEEEVARNYYCRLRCY